MVALAAPRTLVSQVPGAVLDAPVDCLVVGGGIGGAVLALALGQRGKRVTIVEREPAPPSTVRPEVLAQSTIDVFHRLGLGERLLREAAIPLRGLELWHAGGRQLLRFTQEDFHRAGVQPYSTDPGRTRQLLLEAADATRTVEVHRGVEVQELVREGTRIVGVRARRGTERVAYRARVIVGDDGGGSRVRDALGIPLAVREFPLDFLGAAGPALPGLRPDVGQAWIDPARVRSGVAGGVFMPLPGARTALVLLLSAAAHRRLSAAVGTFYAEAARLSPCCETLAQRYRFPQAFAHIRRPFGHAPRYIDDGAAIMGDAAHPVTPAGGQGANMSVADAVALAEVIARALATGDCSARALAAYEAQRRPANHRSLQFSARATWGIGLLQTLPSLAPVARWLIGRVDHRTATKERLLRFVSTAFASAPSKPPVSLNH